MSRQERHMRLRYRDRVNSPHGDSGKRLGSQRFDLFMFGHDVYRRRSLVASSHKPPTRTHITLGIPCIIYTICIHITCATYIIVYIKSTAHLVNSTIRRLIYVAASTARANELDGICCARQNTNSISATHTQTPTTDDRQQAWQNSHTR